jgi:acyl-CoA synthetase (AMP-forming)/AMP-acid ligase II
LSVRYYDWIAHFGRRTPDKIAVIDLASQRRLSHAEFDRRISRLAGHLRDQLGVKRTAGRERLMRQATTTPENAPDSHVS